MGKLFTHTDLDGAGCAVVFHLLYAFCHPGGDCDVEYCGYDDINGKVEEYLCRSSPAGPCFIADISVNDKLAKTLDRKRRDGKFLVNLFDHHPTAVGLNRYAWCDVREGLDGRKTCGAELLYRFCKPMVAEAAQPKQISALERLVEAVREYDTWEWVDAQDGEGCKELNRLLGLYGMDRFVDWCLGEVLDGIFPKFGPVERLALEIDGERAEEYMARKERQMAEYEVCGMRCGVVFAESRFSELGDRLCGSHPGLDFVAIVDVGAGIVHYRAMKDGVDLGRGVARKYGGGGHPESAGSHFGKGVKDRIVSEIFSES